MTRANNPPWFTKAGAASGIMPISHFAGANIFALKGGGHGCLFSLGGIDPESRTDEDLEVRVRDLEAALRGLPPGACLYQYTRVSAGFDLPRQARYADPVTESFASDRIEFLNQNAGFRRIDLHWCLTIEPDARNFLSRKPKEQRGATDRQLFDLEKSATILESHLNEAIGLRLLGKEQAFRFFSYLFNLEEWASDDHLRSDAGIDRQIAQSPVEWHNDYLRIGRRYVQMFALTNTPEISRPCLFTNLMELECDSILCTLWRPRADSATRKEVSSQEKFLEFFKLSPFQRLMSGRNTAPLETTARAKAVASNVDNLTEVVASLDKLGQGDYALRLLLSARTAQELRAATPAVHRLFVDARSPMIEETYGNLSAFYAMFPGNRQFNVYPLWLREDHHARLSSIFAPHLGHPHSEDLDAEYLNIFETRTRTPYFQDAYVNGVRVQLIIGPTGTGKSTLLKALLDHIPLHERLCVIEQPAELKISHPNTVRWEAVEAIPGQVAVTPSQLLAAALRHRPDRIVMGEIRDQCGYDLLQAMNTGHGGTLSTIHAKSAWDALNRLSNLALSARANLNHAFIRSETAEAIDFVLYCERDPTGRRRVRELITVSGYSHAEQSFETEELYRASSAAA
jgi:type IV secretion system protein VirB4